MVNSTVTIKNNRNIEKTVNIAKYNSQSSELNKRTISTIESFYQRKSQLNLVKNQNNFTLYDEDKKEFQRISKQGNY